MAKMQKIAIGSDHAGYDLKEYLKSSIREVKWSDLGTTNGESVDYPDFAEKIGREVADSKVDAGVLICGSGIGMCIAANKVAGIRAAHVESEVTARLSRAHNDANVLCLGSRVLAPEYAKEIVKAWLNTDFEGGRHAKRINKIADLEKKNHGK